MPNPFKRGQAVKYEIVGRTGNTTRGTGTFKAMGERGRCTIKTDEGKELSVYVSKVQANEGGGASPATARGARRSPTGKTDKAAPARATAATARGRGRKADTTKPTARRTTTATSSRRTNDASMQNEQIAALHEKLDAILAKLDSTPSRTTAKSRATGAASAAKTDRGSRNLRSIANENAEDEDQSETDDDSDEAATDGE